MSLHLALHKKATYPLFLAFLIGAFSGCSSPKKKKPEDISYDEKMQGTLEIPSYSRNALDGWPEGRKVDPYDVSRVRLPEDVHAYELGRLPSRDRREMHEAHTVYRVEQSNRWDQRLPATPMTSRGVVLGIREPSHQPVPQDRLVETERARQVQLTEQIAQRVALLNSKQEQIEAFLSSAPDKNKTISELQLAKAKSDKDLADLQKQYQKLNEDLREMKEQKAMEDALQNPAKKSDGTKKSP